jgi:hypothetical protein
MKEAWVHLLRHGPSTTNTTTLAALFVTLCLALITGVWVYQRSSVGISTTNTSHVREVDWPVMDVWEERRRKGIQIVSSSTTISSRRAEDSSLRGKPFGSSYYYAHNSQNSTGGYKDGLRMEDYTMNQPRLLSRSTKKMPVVVHLGDDTAAAEHEEKQVKDEPKKKNPAAPQQPNVPSDRGRYMAPSTTRIIPISKYLWDDPGDETGVAIIRIDSLPDHSTDTDVGPRRSISWKDIEVEHVSAELQGQGLVVIVTTKASVDYRLHIAKLYGAVDTVTVKAKKRLLVRLQKTRGVTHKSNLKAWPHPHWGC